MHTGGLSSYSLVNLVIAHLMAEGYRLGPSNLQGVNTDLGHLLWGFLTRFGTVFDYHDQAVSISQVCVLHSLRPSLVQWQVQAHCTLLSYALRGGLKANHEE